MSVTDGPIRKEDAEAFTFRRYQKVTLTEIADEQLPAGTRVATLEGEYVCSEPSRLAKDVEGNIYPIAESVLKATYELGPP